MKCAWCSKESDAPYHPLCWRRKKVADDKASEDLMLEAHAAIRDIQEGKVVHVSAECMAEYGAYIAKQRELLKAKRGGQKRTDNV